MALGPGHRMIRRKGNQSNSSRCSTVWNQLGRGASTVILSPADTGTYSRLGLRLTCEPQYETNKLYHK